MRELALAFVAGANGLFEHRAALVGLLAHALLRRHARDVAQVTDRHVNRSQQVELDNVRLILPLREWNDLSQGRSVESATASLERVRP